MKPKVFFISFLVAVSTAIGFVPSVGADTLSELETPFQNALQTGNWALALLLIFLTGLATSLTPCVYPMIIITVGVFGALQTKTRIQGAALSSAFVLGIAVFFTPLGLFAAMTGGIFGGFLSNPWVIIGLVALFFTLAASMFGFFEMELPLSIRNRLVSMGGTGIKGAFILGLISALVAAPCTGPVLGFLLTWVGTTGNVVFGAASLFIYALGLGLLFWIVGTFSVTLPKSGVWLEWIKGSFGIVMIVVAIYYLRNLIPGLFQVSENSTLLLVVGISTISIGMLLGAVYLSYYNSSINHRIRKSLGIVLTVIGILNVISYCEMPPDGAKIAWRNDYRAAKTQAIQNRLPLLIDFTASWCAACGELDRKTFSDPKIVKESTRFVMVQIDLSPTKDSDEKRAILEKYQHPGLPLIVIHDKNGKEVSRIGEFIESHRLLKIMHKVD